MEQSPIQRFSLCNDLPLLPILVFATLLRLWQINESLWLDELHSAWVVSAGLAEVAERAQIGNQSSLYFYLLWATTSLFGMSEWALRLPSLIAGVGLVIFAYVLAFEFTRSRIAAIACATLAAIDHNFLFYSTEVRPYAFVQLAAAFQFLIFWRLQDATSVRQRIVFVVSTVLLFYLHYTAILLVAGEVVYSFAHLWCRNKERVYTWRMISVDLACAAAMTLPAVVHVVDVGSRREAWASFINDTALTRPAYWFSLDSYIAVPLIVCLIAGILKVAITLRRDEPVKSGSMFRAVFGLCANVRSSGSSRRSVTATVLLACWFVTPLVTVWLLTVADVARLYLGRYVIGAALAPVSLAGMCIAVCGSRKLQAVAASVIIAYAVYSSGMIQQFRYDGRFFADRAENWRDAVAYVNSNRSEGEVVFVRSGLLEADRLASDESQRLRDYCISPVTSIYRIDASDHEIRPLPTKDAGKLLKADVDEIEAKESAWFIINGSVATRERCAERIAESLFKEFQRATYTEGQQGWVSDERQFGQVGAFRVVLFWVDDNVTPLDDQPTSPNSIAPP